MRTPLISNILRWYANNKRRLPWRNTRNPYRIFISEIMLQQTQVDRVKVFYRTWLKQFPTWESLAAAQTDVLLHAWAGLGYNRRALMVRQAAQQVLATGVPTTIDEWRALKGVGPYTAAAIYAITAQKRAIVIDTNVRRVAGRLFLGIPYPTPAQDSRIARALDRAMPKNDSVWELPQAFMDFGTAQCTSTNPQCARCPFQSSCRAAKKFLRGTAGKKPRTASHEHRHPGKPFPDRIYRGRVLAAIRSGTSYTSRTIGRAVDPSFHPATDADWMARILHRLTREGFICITRGRLALPHTVSKKVIHNKNGA
ncbi:MAG: hypothetical protein RL141_221 [Candidatus Parcubacteria bacterium]|jgi:A/G-specific adenine glycosylase